ncbi:hypothetical protein C8J56DRAFT_1037444 [Mycena floridula]|nr:hypothetical protein C8J56DRAFT_1037444 [Mycena floridula]
MTTVEPLLCNHCGNQYTQDIPVAHIDLFPHLSSTNNSPADAELSAVEADIAVHKNEIRALQAAIDNLHQALDMLESRQEKSKEALRLQKAIIHPLRWLPAEILRTPYCIQCRSSDSPWKVSHVSQYALQMPDLPRAELTQLMLERSFNSPLDIRLYHYRHFLPELHQIVQQLLPSSSRWRSLKVNTAHIKALEPIRGNLQALEDLHFTFRRPYYDSSTTIFEFMPLLTEKGRNRSSHHDRR